MATATIHDQDKGVYVITGIQDDLDPNKKDALRKVPLRLELDDWFLSEKEEHVKQRALFFPSFERFSKEDPKKKLSYFQVAGIHGKPFVSGYCTHSSILFASWHRPYLLLFEHIIYEWMQEEAKKFEGEEEECLEAAKAWRLPYWDWALKKSPVDGVGVGERTYNIPVAFQVDTGPIRRPGGKVGHHFKNPIFQFTMPNGLTFVDQRLVSEDGDGLKNLQVGSTSERDPSGEEWLISFDLCKATSRHPRGNRGGEDPPTAKDWEEGRQNNTAVYATLKSGDYVVTTEGPDVSQETASQGKKKVETYGKTTESLRDTFYRIVMMENWKDFATKRALDGKTDAVTGEGCNRAASIESTHDMIHLRTGGPAVKVETEDRDGKKQKFAYVGHMARVPYASFDPIFWFHHANVDRQIAIWQILNPEAKWFDSETAEKDPRYKDVGNFFLEPQHQDTAETPLRPFHKSPLPENPTQEELAASYWNSRDCKEVTEMGYTYAVLEKWRYLDSETGQYDRAAHSRALNEMLNHNYNAARSAGYKWDITGMKEKPKGLPKLIAEGHQLKEELEIDDYAVNVTYEKFALGGYPFTISFFIGAVPDGGAPYSYADPKSSLGEVYNFSTPSPSLGTDEKAGCGNCKKQETVSAMSTGRVVLTNALITRYKQQIVHTTDVVAGPPADGSDYVSILEGVEPETVIPFMKSNLHWRVTTATGDIVPLDRPPSLKVAFVAGKATHYRNVGKASKFGGYKTAVEVTEGREGSVGSADLSRAVEQVRS
ncbi:common central domain of tyrosinase-domain-containing protein [Cladorrhinum sp. PSN332]|nr:common central domain of tyrosinase-domain-containing protein [Cladorrhinum sp. PSN332]